MLKQRCSCADASGLGASVAVDMGGAFSKEPLKEPSARNELMDEGFNLLPSKSGCNEKREAFLENGRISQNDRSPRLMNEKDKMENFEDRNETLKSCRKGSLTGYNVFKRGGAERAEEKNELTPYQRGRPRERTLPECPEYCRNNRERTPLVGRMGRRNAISISIGEPDANPNLTGNTHLMLTKAVDDMLGIQENSAKVNDRQWRRRSTIFRGNAPSNDISDDEETDTANRRYISKHHGYHHINYTDIPIQKKRIVADMFHLVVESPWSVFLLVFALAFILSWLLFACLWLALVRYDKSCVLKVDSFATAFLYSVETQTTIGYGGRAVTDLCGVGVLLLCVQYILGAFITCTTLGTMFAKMSRPNTRGRCVRFTKQAVITVRDGRYCLIFRIVDLGKKKLVTNNMRLLLVKHRFTKEGHFIPVDMRDLKVTIDCNQVEYTLNIFPIFPVSIVHIIDRNSPLYHLNKNRFYHTTMEIVAVLEGVVPSNGNTTQVVTSYKPTEVRWGHRFQPLFLRRTENEQRNVLDLEDFDGLVKEGVTPDCSAEEYRKRRACGWDGDGEGTSDEDYGERAGKPTMSRQQSGCEIG